MMIIDKIYIKARRGMTIDKNKDIKARNQNTSEE